MIKPLQGPITWSDAFSQSVQWTPDSHLAALTNAAENQFVFENLVDDPRFWWRESWGPWIGGVQQFGAVEPDQGWRWVTGEPFVFANWGAGEPNNANPNENHIHFSKRYQSQSLVPFWNDADRSDIGVRLTAYVIESSTEPTIQIQAVPIPAAV